MLKKLIIVLALFVAGWLGATYYNNQNPNEEIIGGDTQETNTEIINNKPSGEEQGATTTTEMDETMRGFAKKYCDNAGVSEVQLNTNFIKVISNLPGGGSSYYPTDGGSSFSCPVVAPDSMSKDCKAILESSENEWESVCSE